MDSSGRILDENCFDINPGLWHLVITHQLGLEHRALVADLTYDYEVWNYPIYKYELTYFNPQTHAISANPAGAMIPMSSYQADWFPSHRPDQARYAIGIAMDVWYSVETSPHMGGHGEPAIRRMRLVYDLEMDEDFRIIGGEWYQNAHPDFAWTLAKGDLAEAPEERKLVGEWSILEPIPLSWRDSAAQAARRGQPLSVIVRSLTQAALTQEILPPLMKPRRSGSATLPRAGTDPEPAGSASAPVPALPATEHR